MNRQNRRFILFSRVSIRIIDIMRIELCINIILSHAVWMSLFLPEPFVQSVERSESDWCEWRWNENKIDSNQKRMKLNWIWIWNEIKSEKRIERILKWTMPLQTAILTDQQRYVNYIRTDQLWILIQSQIHYSFATKR